ncbi:sodium:solute symporter family protein [Halorientalis sp.]|jgi:SSS family solute:Na+ symporter|uniref:sodium:solute symporter family protein n=1 Tax=Halorientalis sp. TaxID=1931229 RepID=UPI00262344ED|nr:sodium:solute symporter family protein [Halorientalis sp.]
MAETALQLGIILGYLLLALGVGVVAYRLTDRTAEDYFLASRTLGTVVLLFTTFATLLSAFTFFGGPTAAYRAGPEWILVMGLMDGVLFGLLWYVIGYKQWLVGKVNGYVTLGEMIGDRFGSPILRVLIAGISLFWLLPYVMLQQQGAGTAIAALTQGAVPYWVGAGGITLFMIVYVVLSGMRGVAWTDTLQGLFMLGMIWVAVAWILSVVGGPGAATAELAAASPGHLTLGGGLYTPAYVLSTAISIAFGVTMFPQVNQRFFVAGSKRVLKRTFALWPVLVILLFVPAFMLGAWAQGLGIVAGEGENVLPLLLNEYTPAWFAALVVAGAVAAMMSSSDSMLLSGSSYLTRDVYRQVVSGVTERREALVGRMGVVVIALLSFVASLFQPGTLIDIGETAFGGFAQLALPVLVALYWSGTTRYGMYAGIGGSQLFYLGSVFLPFVPAGYVLPFAPGLGGWSASVVGMGLGLLLTLGVSVATGHAAGEDAAAYQRLSAD